MQYNNIFEFVLLDDFETVKPFLSKVVSLVSDGTSFYVRVFTGHCDNCEKNFTVARIVVDDHVDDGEDE